MWKIPVPLRRRQRGRRRRQIEKAHLVQSGESLHRFTLCGPARRSRRSVGLRTSVEPGELCIRFLVILPIKSYSISLRVQLILRARGSGTTKDPGQGRSAPSPIRST